MIVRRHERSCLSAVNYRIAVKPQKGIGYVLRAEVAPGKQLKGSFKPAYTVRSIKAPQTRGEDER